MAPASDGNGQRSAFCGMGDLSRKRFRQCDPSRIYASQTSRVVRPNHSTLGLDAEKMGHTPGSRPEDLKSPDGTSERREQTSLSMDCVPGTHQWYDGNAAIRGSLRARWASGAGHCIIPKHVYGPRGRRTRRCLNRRTARQIVERNCPVLRKHDTGPKWQPGARRHVSAYNFSSTPQDPLRIYVTISAAGAFRTDDGGQNVENRSITGCIQNIFPIQLQRSAHLRFIASRCIQSRPNTLFMQKHWDVMRSDDGGDLWREVSGNLPSDFGFPIDVHAHEPETVYRGADQERFRAIP